MINACAAIPCQIYHSEDNISDLRVRVSLRPCKPAGRHAPQQTPVAVDGSITVASDALVQDATGNGLETEIFGWQERVLGHHEAVSSGAASPNVEDGGRVATIGQPRQGRGLFSRRLPEGTLVHKVDEPTTLSDADDDAHARRCNWWPWSRSDCGAAENKPLLASEIAARLLPCDRMQLLAVLEAQPQDGLNDLPLRWEVLLCELRAHSGGTVLEVQPPFFAADGTDRSNAVLPYRFQLPDGTWWDYSIENASHVPTEAERQKAVEDRRGFDACVPQMRSNLAGSGFDDLGEAEAVYTVVGEIVSFDLDGNSIGSSQQSSKEGGACDDLETEGRFRCTQPMSLWSALFRPNFFVVFELSLPVSGKWEVLSSSGAVGPGGDVPTCTQVASPSGCSSRVNSGICVFNHPVELHLAEAMPKLDVPEQSFPDPQPPRLVLQVMQSDAWDRLTLHGYAFVDIPRKPGEYEVKAQLWAPVGTIKQQLSATFCGAFIPLASPHLVAVADMHQRDTLPRNRSALRAQTASGAVVVRLQVMKQRLSGTQPLSRGRRASRERGRVAAARDVTGVPGGGVLPERAIAGLRRRRRRIFDAGTPSMQQQSADVSAPTWMNQSGVQT